MPKHQIEFFGTNADVTRVFRSLESLRSVQYVSCKAQISPEATAFSSIEQVLDSSTGHTDAAQNHGFLIMAQGSPVTTREVPQRRSNSSLFFFDQMLNPDSVVLKPSVLIENREAIIAGSVGTISTSQASQALWKEIATSIRSTYIAIRSYYVGPRAHELWLNGYRLTVNLSMPKEYDLAVDA